MTSAIDDLNTFLDATDRNPTRSEEHEVANILNLLSVRSDSDPAFFGRLERRLTATSNPNLQLVSSSLVPATPSESGFPRRRTAGLAAAALIIALLTGALLGGLVATRNHKTTSEAFAPGILTSPSVSHDLPIVTSTSETKLYTGPGDQNTLLMTVAAGVSFNIRGSRTIDSGFWFDVQIKGTTISGWARSIDLAPLQAATQRASNVTTPASSKVSPTSVVVLNGVGSTDASSFDIGAVTWVTARTSVWSNPGPEMSIQGQALPQDQLMVTGPPVNFDGETWLPVENWAMGDSGWVAASALATLDATSEIIGEPNSTRQVVTSLLGAALFPKPDVFSTSLTTLEPGTTLIVTDASNQSGTIWFKLEIPGTTVTGWCKAELASPASPQVRLDAIALIDRSQAFSPLAPNSSVTVAQQIRVWSQPGTAMSTVTTATVTDQLTITAHPIEFNGRIWVAVKMNATGQSGWVLSAYINPIIRSIPAGGFDTMPAAVITIGGATLYEKPSKESTALVSLYPGIELPVKASISIDGVRWHQVQIPGTNVIGWSRISKGELSDISTTPVSSAAPITFSGNAHLQPGVAVRTNGAVSVWSIPGPDMSRSWTAGPDDAFSVLSAPSDHIGASWVQVKDQTTGQTGWIVTSFLFPIDAGTPTAP